MKFDPKVHHRRSIRLQGYDYSQAGAYFVTIVAWQREMLFGEIMYGEILLNDFGKIVAEKWQWLEKQYEYVELSEWIVMPNHLHGILVIHDNGRGGSRPAPTIQSTHATVCPKLSVRSNRFLHGGLIYCVMPRAFLSGSGIITNTSSATNPKWTGFPVTSNPTQHNGRTMMKTRIAFTRRGRGRSRTTPIRNVV
jgi:REP element-mobilizing transposase RayT